jgi:hypothetical protein
MKQQTVLCLAFAASLLAATPVVNAHADHDHETPKLKPETCEQLADRTRYSNDLADPDIKALKDKCDAEKKSEEPIKEAKKDE